MGAHRGIGHRRRDGAWQFRVKQNGPNNSDFYFTAVSIKDVTEELTPALTVTPRVALVGA